MLLHFSNSFESERIDIDPFPSSRRYYTRGLKGNGKVIKREEERGAGKNSETTRFDSLSPSQTLFFFYKSRKSTVHPCISFFFISLYESSVNARVNTSRSMLAFFFSFSQSFFSSPIPSFFLSSLPSVSSVLLFLSLSLCLSLRLRRLNRGAGTP